MENKLTPDQISKALDIAMFQAAEETFKRIGFRPNDIAKQEQIEVALLFCQIINHPMYK